MKRFQHRGLRVICQHSPGPLTGIALVVRAGARFDGEHPGIAHVSEHMLFQGTDKLDQVALNHRAAELGGEHNADTGYETISLTFEVFNEDTAAALELLADQFYRSNVNERRFRKEKRVVFDEIRGRIDDPNERLYQRAWQHFFKGAIAHPVCGSISSLRGMQATDVAQFIRSNFTHDRTVLAIVGGAEMDVVRAAVRKHFNGRPEPSTTKIPRVGRGGNGRLRVRTSGSQAVIMRMIEISPDPKELIHVGLALDLVGADPDSHLFQEVRERLGLGYDVSTSLDSGPDWAVAMIAASANRDSVERLRRAVDDVVQRAADEGFTDEEVARAKKKLRYRYASLALSRLERALALAEGTLSGFPIPEEAERMVHRMTRDEVQRSWQRTLQGRTLTAVLS
ncbi:MAG TPA: pitrilysin family protein [Terriglobales bacterium]|nr:pitrilysin family protein [Terriglobales bacterium]